MSDPTDIGPTPPDIPPTPRLCRPNTPGQSIDAGGFTGLDPRGSLSRPRPLEVAVETADRGRLFTPSRLLDPPVLRTSPPLTELPDVLSVAVAGRHRLNRPHQVLKQGRRTGRQDPALEELRQLPTVQARHRTSSPRRSRVHGVQLQDPPAACRTAVSRSGTVLKAYRVAGARDRVGSPGNTLVRPAKPSTAWAEPGRAIHQPASPWREFSAATSSRPPSSAATCRTRPRVSRRRLAPRHPQRPPAGPRGRPAAITGTRLRAGLPDGPVDASDARSHPMPTASAAPPALVDGFTYDD